MNAKIKQTLLAVAVGSAVSMPAMATNGNQATATGQSARGTAGAGIAYPQDTLAVGINPAAGVHIGNRVDVGLEWFKPDRDLTVTGLGPASGTYSGNDTSAFIIPEFGYNKQLGNDRAFTLAIYGAGGQNTDYSNHPFLGGPAYINLSQLFVQPTYSAKVGEKHSFGVSAIFAFQQLEARGLGAFAGSTFNPAALTDNGKSNSHGIGMSFGWIGQVTDRLTLGATYQTKIEMSDFDEYKGLIPGGNIEIPEKYGIGLAFAATPKLDVLLDVTQVNYSNTAALGNPTSGDGVSPLGFPGGPGFGWKDTTVYRLGVVYKHSPKLTLRFGYNHGDQPVPNTTFNDTFFNSLTPAVTQDHVSLGFTYRIKPKMLLTGSYVRTLEETVTGPSAGPGSTNALRMDQDAVGISLGWEL